MERWVHPARRPRLQPGRRALDHLGAICLGNTYMGGNPRGLAAQAGAALRRWRLVGDLTFPVAIKLFQAKASRTGSLHRLARRAGGLGEGWRTAGATDAVGVLTLSRSGRGHARCVVRQCLVRRLFSESNLLSISIFRVLVKASQIGSLVCLGVPSFQYISVPGARFRSPPSP